MRSLTHDAQKIYHAALDAVRAEVLLDAVQWEAILPNPLTSYQSIRVLAFGKSALPMGSYLESMLGDRLDAGLVIVPHGYVAAFDGPSFHTIQVIEAGHPVPDASSGKAGRALIEQATQAGEGDLVIVLISGGGSALTLEFADGISLEEGQETVQLLLKSGADIHELNAVRKHLSIVGGGKLAQAAMPATVLALVISDVIRDDLSVIASGPAVPDPSTREDALAVLDRYGLQDRVPAPVMSWLHHPDSETPAHNDPAFDRGATHLIGTNQDALLAAQRCAESLGYEVLLEKTPLKGEAREMGEAFAQRMKGGGRLRCYLQGGETTVTVKGSGKGGRNQEMALAGAMMLADEPHSCVMLCGGTDGIDGPTDAGGAIATPQTLPLARQLGLKAQAFLENNDAYAFFEQVDGLLKPGPTHVNVMDIAIGLVADEG